MKDIKDYEGLYAITEDGQVWSYKSKKFLKPFEAHGYLRVALHKDGKRKNCVIHRLVALTYIPNPDNLPQVNHKDEDKHNNNIHNLEWCSAQYNHDYGTHNQRVSVTKSIPVYCVELNKVFYGMSEAARQLGLNHRHISECCRGKLKTHGGYHWRYADE